MGARGRRMFQFGVWAEEDEMEEKLDKPVYFSLSGSTDVGFNEIK